MIIDILNMMNNVIRCVIDMSICDLYHELEGKGVYVLEKVILYDMVKSVIDFCNLSNKEVDDFLEICIDFYKNEILNRDDYYRDLGIYGIGRYILHAYECIQNRFGIPECNKKYIEENCNEWFKDGIYTGLLYKYLKAFYC